MPEPTPVETLIGVFISSHQREFQVLRNSLRDAIDGEDLFSKFIMRAELVEKKGGTTIKGDISAAMERSAIYVGIFGNRFSEPVQLEYEEAKRRGLPVLVFEIPPSKKETRDKRLKTLISRMKRVDDTRVMTIGAKRERLDVITQRIAVMVADMMLQNKRIRTTLNPQ